MPLHIEKQTFFTEEDYYNLPDDVSAELINGKLYYMASPTQLHQEISMELSRRIANYLANIGGPCKVLPAPFDVKLHKNKDDIVQPDISIICDRNKLDGKRCNGAPDWIIEIVSPSSATHDYVTKMMLYENAGVKEYWIVNPQEKTIVIYNFQSKSDIISEYSFEDKIKVGIYEDLAIDFAEISKIIF